MTAAPRKHRLIIISNRLPFVLNRSGDRWNIKPGTGGLVSALLPVLRDRGGVWIGWPGVSGESEQIRAVFNDAVTDTGYTLIPVTLTEEQVHEFYQGFSNEIIWPLFHDLQSLCNFDPSYWQTYQEVNRKFAEIAARYSTPEDFIWVQDYHLFNVATELRRRQVKSKIGFFLHIPFPSLDMFLKLPWRFSLLHALLEYDLIGFQTVRDRRNFIQCLRTLVKDVTVYGKGQVLELKAADRQLRAGVFPISIDYGVFAKEAASDAVTDKVVRLHRQSPDRQLIIGVDRLDYTKAIPQRLEAFRYALRRYPDMHNRVTLIQAVVPSRVDIPRYHELRTTIDGLIGEINGEFTRPGGWIPIHYVFHGLDRPDLLAYYRASRIGLVTPVKDGMNLVAKEFCAASVEERSVLILSEFAGAAAQLQNWALLVNPYDIEGTADTIHQAFTMSDDECRWRMHRMRRSIRNFDIFRWVDSYLQAVIAKDLSAFPIVDDFVPQDNVDIALH